MSEQGDWEKFIGPWKDPSPKPIKVTKIEEGGLVGMIDWGHYEPSKWEGFKFVQTDKLPLDQQKGKSTADNFWENIG